MSDQLEIPFDERPRTRANPPRAVVVFSGGQDSTTCLYYAKDMGFRVHAITFDYGQRHKNEVHAAVKIARLLGVASHEVVKIPDILKSTSPLLDGSELPQYDHHSKLPGGLEKTFVPMRNQLFLTIAANRAYLLGAEALITGVCEEDYGGYPDCRQEFIHSLAHACNKGAFTGKDGAPASLAIIAPLMRLTKAQSVRLAMSIDGCYAALSFTQTGYDGAFPPDGRDHATLLRVKGFEEAGVPDPLILRAHYAGLMTLPDSQNYNRAIIDAVLKRFDLINYWKWNGEL